MYINNVNLCIYILRIFVNIKMIITSKYKYSNIYKYNYCISNIFKYISFLMLPFILKSALKLIHIV